MKKIKLSHRWLGNSGLRVSNICLGTMTFGESKIGRPGQCNEELSHKILDRFVECGGNFIDTADVYQDGESEKIIGNWLTKEERNKYVIATKVRFASNRQGDVNAVGLSRKHIVESIEDSLGRLKTDYVDLYQIHAWDSATPIEETLRTLDDLVRSGKVRYLGASNVTGWQLQKIIDLSQHMGLNKWITLQAQYSLMCRWTELELVEICKNEGVGLLPWSPLKGGWLTGKVLPDSIAPPEGSRMAFAEANPKINLLSHPNFSQYSKNDQVWNILELLGSIGEKHGKSIPQVALRWLLQKDTVCAPIIGVKTLEQLNDDLGASTGWELSSEEMKNLNKASAIEYQYPYDIVRRSNAHAGRTRDNWCT